LPVFSQENLGAESPESTKTVPSKEKAERFFAEPISDWDRSHKDGISLSLSLSV